MPFLYVTAEELTLLDQTIAKLPAEAALPHAWASIHQQRVPEHKVVREITYTGDEATLREQLGRSMPDGVKTVGSTQLVVRTISNSLPQRSDPVEGR